MTDARHLFTDVSSDLVDLVGRADDADVAALGAEIDRLRSRVRRLRAVRDALAAALGKPPARATDRPGRGGGHDADRPRRRLLLRAIHRDGPLSLNWLARLTKLPEATLPRLLDHPWFARPTPAGSVSLTPRGRAAADRLAARSPSAGTAAGPLSTAPAGCAGAATTRPG